VSAVLVNLAMVVGFFLCLISMLVGFVRGVSFWTVLFRSAIVLTIATVVVMAFFRYFNIILYRFLAQKIEEKRRKESSPEIDEEIRR
jgi:phosphoglycerol transferase MdoB-like AlkP superfamily enzyme